jgi:hypothetical protein
VAVPDTVVILPPDITVDQLHRSLACEVVFSQGPVFTLAGETKDAWGRVIRLFQAADGTVANHVLCPLSQNHFVQYRGELALNAWMLLNASLVALGLPRANPADLEKVALKAKGERAEFFATLLAVALVEAGDGTVAAFKKWLMGKNVGDKVMAAERISYRCEPRLVQLVEEAAAAKGAPEALGDVAAVYRAILQHGPGPAAIAAVEGRDVSGFKQTLLELGPPGRVFVDQV